MRYQDLYNQYLNYYNNPTTAQAPNVPIAQEAPSQKDNMISQGAGLAGKGAGIYAGGKLGGALFGGSKLAAPQLVGAKVVGSNAPIALTANPSLPASYTGGKLGLSSAAGTVAPLAAVGHGLYTGGKFLAGDKLNTGEKLAYALPTAGLSLFSDELQGLFGSGKSKEQKAREGFRGKLAELGLLESLGDKAYSVNFEGQDPYLMGFNGSFLEQDRGIRDLAKVLSRDADAIKSNARNPWDIDYTSDLDMMTSVASNSLGGLLGGSGKLGTTQQHIFNELANASLADTDREFNEANWANTMGDMRLLYEKAGFTDADTAYNRINQLAEAGMDQQEADQLRQGVGLVFGDNSFGLASDLNSTRWADDLEYAGADYFQGGSNPTLSQDPMAQTRPMTMNTNSSNGWSANPDMQVKFDDYVNTRPVVGDLQMINVMPQLNQEQLAEMMAKGSQEIDPNLLASLAGALA